MVKTVVGEEAPLRALEETLSASASPAQVGLVVGKLSASSDRALAYSLVPTPPTDSGAPACSLLRAAPNPNPKPKPNPKGAKAASSDASSSLEFDVDWVAEHARQIRLPVVQAEPFKKVISKAISHLTKEVQNAKALIDGVLFLDDMDNTLEGPHNVEFLVPFKNNLPAEV